MYGVPFQNSSSFATILLFFSGLWKNSTFYLPSIVPPGSCNCTTSGTCTKVWERLIKPTESCAFSVAKSAVFPPSWAIFKVAVGFFWWSRVGLFWAIFNHESAVFWAIFQVLWFSFRGKKFRFAPPLPGRELRRTAKYDRKYRLGYFWPVLGYFGGT